MPILGEPAPLATARELITSEAAPRGRGRRGTMGRRVDWRRPGGVARRRRRRIDPRRRAGQRCVSSPSSPCSPSSADAAARPAAPASARAVGGRVDCAIAARARVDLWRGTRRRRCRLRRAVAGPMEPGRAGRREHRHWRRPRRVSSIGGAAGLGYSLATSHAEGGLAAPRGRRRLVVAGATAAACGAGRAGPGACRPASRWRHDSLIAEASVGIAGDLDLTRAIHRRARLRSADRRTDCDGRRRAVRPRPGARSHAPPLNPDRDRANHAHLTQSLTNR